MDIGDLVTLLSHWGQSGMTWAHGDFDGDGTVDIGDLNILLSHWALSLGPPAVSVGNAGGRQVRRKAAPGGRGASLTVTDPESYTLASASVAISGGPLDAAAELLVATTAGTHITAAYNATAGVLTLSGTDTLADYNQVLQSVTYVNTLATSATLGDRTLHVCGQRRHFGRHEHNGHGRCHGVGGRAGTGGQGGAGCQPARSAEKPEPAAGWQPAPRGGPGRCDECCQGAQRLAQVMASGIATPGARLGRLPWLAAYDAVLQSGAWRGSGDDSDDGPDGPLGGLTASR